MSSPRMSTPSMWPHVVALLHFLGLVLCCFVAVCLCTVVLGCIGGLRFEWKNKNCRLGLGEDINRLTPNLNMF